MKRLSIIAAVLTAAVFAAGCASSSTAAAADAPVREAGKAYMLMVLHTNDHHGTTLSKEGIAGLAERAAFVKQVRAENENVLVVDAGDINTGSALSNMFHAEPDIAGYNLIGYDAVTFGNHEFDGDLSVLQQQMEQSDFDWVCANITRGQSYLGKPYIVKDYDGFRVGIIGLTTLRTTVIASPDESLTFTDEIEAAAMFVPILREQELCDIVIVLAHLGSVEEAEGQNTSQKLAAAVPGIDLIIDGHSHTKFEEPLYINGTPIVSANEWGKYVGEGRFTIVDGQVADFTWQPVEITSESFPPDAEMTALLQPYADEANASLKQVVMQTGAEFEFGDRLSRYREIALGDLTCDAQVWYVRSHGMEADFALTNGGNIRAALPAGDVTKEDIMTVLPFENYIYVVALSGQDVLDLFNFIASVPQGAGGFAQVSKEARYTITYDADGTGTLSDLTINGEPVDPARTYRIVTNDYLAGGGDGYTALTRSVDTFNTSMLLSDIVIEYAQTLAQPVMPETDGRITIVGGAEP